MPLIFCSFINNKIASLQKSADNLPYMQAQPKKFHLPDQNKPILLFQQLYSQPQHQYQDNHNHDHNYNHSHTFIITTIDGYVYKIQIKEVDFYLHYQFKMEIACNCMFFAGGNMGMDDQLTRNSSQRSRLFLGCLNGSIRHYSQTTRQVSPQKYTPIPSQQSPPICLYLRKTTLFIWYVNSFVVLLDQHCLAVKSKLNLNIDICSAIVLRNRELDGPAACVALKGWEVPFVFDCDNEIAVVEDYWFMKEYYQKARIKQVKEGQQMMPRVQEEQEEEEVIREQIQLMAQDKNQRDLIVSASVVLSQQLYFVTIYKIHQQDAHKLCQPILRLQISLHPIFLDIKGSYILVCEWQRIELLNYKQRKRCFTVRKSKHRWGFILRAEERDLCLRYKFMISKGFNEWDPPGSKLGAVYLNLRAGQHPDPVNILGDQSGIY